MDIRHVRFLCSHILRSHVAATQRGDEFSIFPVEHGTRLRIILVEAGIVNHDAFASSPPQTGQRILTGHTLGQPQSISQAIFESRIVPVSYPAGALSATRLVHKSTMQHIMILTHLKKQTFVLHEITPVRLNEPGHRIKDRVGWDELLLCGVKDKVESSNVL